MNDRSKLYETIDNKAYFLIGHRILGLMFSVEAFFPERNLQIFGIVLFS